MVPPADGARTTIFCATDPTLAGVSGSYYDRQRESTPSLNAQDDAFSTLARAVVSARAAR